MLLIKKMSKVCEGGGVILTGGAIFNAREIENSIIYKCDFIKHEKKGVGFESSHEFVIKLKPLKSK